MFRTAIFAALLATTACVADDLSSTEQDLDQSGDNGGGEPHDAKVYHARGNAQPGGATSSPNLTWHGGPVITAGTVVQPIFWGTSWGSPGDKISGMNALYAGFGGSKYMGTNTEYTDGSGHVSAAVTARAAVVDTSAAARNGSRTSTILAEVCKLYPNPTPNAYYPVYIDNKRGHSGYCAWHSTGTCNGVRVQFGFFFKLDGDNGCDPQDSSTTWSQGTEALANVSGHELSEMVTDPQLNAWYDSSGAENSDKCAWTFSGTRVALGSSSWKIQGNWSNAAYNGSSGYDGGGCIDGN
jgi:hypothetical protein